MTSHRRFRLLIIAVITALVVILYYSTDTHPSQKYIDLLHEMNLRDKEDVKVAKGVSERLKEAEGQAKSKANIKNPSPTLKGVGEMKTNGGGEEAQTQTQTVDGKKNDKVNSKQELLSEQTSKAPEPDNSMENLLTTILKRSPIIIFSKSYCPYSRAAKNILLNKYTINPPPHVVELDKIPEGWVLQDILKDRTGRGTVPNILVNGKSIGGCDEVKDLDQSEQLIDLLIKMGGKRFTKLEKNN